MEIQEMKEKIKGILPVQPTPFTESGELNIAGLKENTRFLADFAERGNKDLVIVTNGSTGEFYAMSDEEQKAAIETVVKASGNIPVIAGTSRAGTRETVKMSKYAESVGADLVMVVLPYYNQATKEGMYQHYKTIAASINVGVMLYNNPFCSGSWVNADLMTRISKIPNVIAVKENTSSAVQYHDICRKVDPEDMTLICGLGERMYPAACAYRCSGFLTYIGNFAPEIAYELYEYGREKDFDKMNQVLNRLNPFFDVMDKALANREETSIMPDTRRGNPVYQAMAKFGLDYVGLNGGKVRLPMVGLTEKERSELKKALDQIGVKKVS